jgi:hypothetical protein
VSPRTKTRPARPSAYPPRPSRSPRASANRSPRLRGGALGWLIGGLVFLVAAGVLAWMVLLPAAVESRFAAATGADLRLQGLAGDPFSGKANVTGWTLRETGAPGSPMIARGAASSLHAPGWRGSFDASEGELVVIDRLDIHLVEARLAPDADGRWPLLAIAAASGLPYERGGPVGDESPRLRIKKLRLRVDTIHVRNAATGQETPVAINWIGEFSELDHTRPVVAALLAAARAR